MILFSLINMQDQGVPSEVVRLLDSRSYVLANKLNRPTYPEYTFYNATQRSFIRFVYGPGTQAGNEITAHNIDASSARLVPDRGSYLKLASKLPLGLMLRSSFGSGTAKIVAGSASARVHVFISHGGKREGGTTVWPNFDRTRDAELCEGIARWLLATETAKYMTSTTVSFGQTNYAGYTNTKGLRQIRLNEWASKLGYQVQWNADMARAFVSGAKGTILIPLGGNQVKVNDKWVPIDGVVGAVGSEPLVPVPAIQALLK
jgi:hypothetical protein